MFFILSKILFFLIVPFWWIILLVIWMLIAKSPTVKKRLRITIIILLVVFTNPFLFRSMVLLWQPEQVSLGNEKKYSAAILLGGMAAYDKFDRGHFGMAADRFIQTANLYHRGIVQKIVISGGTGQLRQNEPPESDFLRTEFIANGIPDSAIIIENRSRNTYENAVYSKRIVDSLHLKPPFLLVTSAMHMKRSEHVFRKIGINFESYPTDFQVTQVKPVIEKFIAPNPEILNEWTNFLKEIVGLYVYKLTGKA